MYRFSGFCVLFPNNIFKCVKLQWDVSLVASEVRLLVERNLSQLGFTGLALYGLFHSCSQLGLARNSPGDKKNWKYGKFKGLNVASGGYNLVVNRTIIILRCLINQSCYCIINVHCSPLKFGRWHRDLVQQQWESSSSHSGVPQSSTFWREHLFIIHHMKRVTLFTKTQLF